MLCAGLLQSLLVAACLGLTPVLQCIPSAVLWGYFAFMALESLQGSQFWERLLYLLTDPARRYRCVCQMWCIRSSVTALPCADTSDWARPAARLLEQGHAPYVETLPIRAVAAFTLFQLAYLGLVYGITWIPIAGFLFPLPIIALVPIRTYLLPKVMERPKARSLAVVMRTLQRAWFPWAGVLQGCATGAGCIGI